MAKAILEFDLTDHDDTIAHKRCVLSPQIVSALSDFDDYLRDLLRYREEYLKSKSATEVTEEAREKLREVMFDRGVIIDDLIN